MHAFDNRQRCYWTRALLCIQGSPPNGFPRNVMTCLPLISSGLSLSSAWIDFRQLHEVFFSIPGLNSAPLSANLTLGVPKSIECVPLSKGHALISVRVTRLCAATTAHTS